MLRDVNPGPRVRLACRLYASGAVSSKLEACRAVGLAPQYLSMLDSAGNEVTRRIQDQVEEAIHDDTIALSRVVQIASRKALRVMNKLMDSADESIALKSSSDILDRNPETSKSFKATIGTFSLDTADVKDIAHALVESARIKERLASAPTGDYVQVEIESGEGKVQIPQGAQAHGSPAETEEADDGQQPTGQAASGPAKVKFVLIPGGPDGKDEEG